MHACSRRPTEAANGVPELALSLACITHTHKPSSHVCRLKVRPPPPQHPILHPSLSGRVRVSSSPCACKNSICVIICTTTVWTVTHMEFMHARGKLDTPTFQTTSVRFYVQGLFRVLKDEPL